MQSILNRYSSSEKPTKIYFKNVWGSWGSAFVVLVVEVVLVIVLVVEVILVEPSVQCVHNDLLLGCTLGEGLIGIFEGEDAWSTVAPHSLAGH